MHDLCFCLTVCVKPFVDSNTVNRCCVVVFVHYISGECCSTLVGISVCRHRLTSPIKISSMLENNEFMEKLADSGGSNLLDIYGSSVTDLYLL